MANRTAVLSVRIVSDSKAFRKGMQAAEKTVAKFEKAVAKTAKVTAMTTAVGALGAAALAGASNLAALGASIAAIAGAAVAVPGMLAGFAVGLAVMAAALKDLPTVLGDLAPAFGSLQDAISARFWSGAEKPIRALVSSTLPALTSGLSGVATSLGGFFGTLAGAIQKVATPEALGGLFSAVKSSIDTAKGALAPLVTAFAALGSVGIQYLDPLAKWFVQISESFAAFTTQAAADGTLKTWIDNGLAGIQSLWGVLTGLGSILSGIGTAALAAGGAPLQALSDGLGKVAAIVNGPAFQGALTTIFTGAHAAMSSLTGALGPVGDMFVAIAPALGGFLALAGQIAGQVLSVFAPALATLLTAAWPLVETIGGALLTVLGQFGAWFAANQPLIATFAAQLSGTLTAAVQTLTPIVSGLLAGFGGLATFVMQNGQAFTALGAAVLGGIAAFHAIKAAMTAYSTVMAAVTVVKTGLTTAMAAYRAGLTLSTAIQAGFNALVAANPIALVVIAVAALVAGIVYLATQTQFFQTVWKAVTDFIGTAIGVAAGIFQSHVQAMRSVWEGIVKGVQDLWKGAMAFIGNVAKVQIAIVTGIIRGIVGIVSGVVTGVRNFFNAAFQFVASIVRTQINIALAVIRGITGVVSGIVNGVRSFFSAAFQFVAGIVKGNINTVVSIIRGITSVVTGVVNGVRTGFTNAFNAVRSVVQPVINGVVGAINNISGAVQNAIGWVRDLFNNFQPPGWLSGILGMGGTGFDITGNFGIPAMPATAGAGIGSTGGISVAKVFSSGNEPRRTNKHAERKAGGVTLNQTINAVPGMSAEQIGTAASRELMFRLQG